MWATYSPAEHAVPTLKKSCNVSSVYQGTVLIFTTLLCRKRKVTTCKRDQSFCISCSFISYVKQILLNLNIYKHIVIGSLNIAWSRHMLLSTVLNNQMHFRSCEHIKENSCCKNRKDIIVLFHQQSKRSSFFLSTY